MRRDRGFALLIVLWTLGLLALFLVMGTLYLARHPLLRVAGESWVVEDPLEKSDAIIELSIDNFYADRATRSAELYREGLAPLVVASAPTRTSGFWRDDHPRPCNCDGCHRIDRGRGVSGIVFVSGLIDFVLPELFLDCRDLLHY